MQARQEDVRIRRAVIADAGAIARTQIESWQATYRGIVADAYLDGMRIEDRELLWRDRLRVIEEALPQSLDVCFVAVDSAERILGFARGGRARPLANGANPAPFDGELYAIYLAPGYERRGIGSRLTHAVASYLAAGGIRGLLIWALAQNPNRVFYETLAGEECFRQVIVIDDRWLTEVAYGWPNIQTLIERTTWR